MRDNQSNTSYFDQNRCWFSTSSLLRLCHQRNMNLFSLNRSQFLLHRQSCWRPWCLVLRTKPNHNLPLITRSNFVDKLAQTLRLVFQLFHKLFAHIERLITSGSIAERYEIKRAITDAVHGQVRVAAIHIMRSPWNWRWQTIGQFQ